jgi:hypothetical protein
MDVAMVFDMFDLLRVFKVVLEFEFMGEFAWVKVEKLDCVVLKTN